MIKNSQIKKNDTKMNLNIRRKKLLSLLVLGNMMVSNIPHASAEVYAQGDVIKANKVVNIRNNNGFDGEIIDIFKKDDMAKRIISCDNGWDLVSYNDKLGFVKSEYFTDCSNENVYCDINFTERRESLMTTEYTRMHIDPFEEANVIIPLEANTRVDTYAYVSNNWYLVKVHDKIGFVDGRYLESSINMETGKVVKALGNVNIRAMASTSSFIYGILSVGDTLPYIADYDDEWYIINYNGKEAYIKKRYVKLEEIKDKRLYLKK